MHKTSKRNKNKKLSVALWVRRLEEELIRSSLHKPDRPDLISRPSYSQMSWGKPQTSVKGVRELPLQKGIPDIKEEAVKEAPTEVYYRFAFTSMCTLLFQESLIRLKARFEERTSLSAFQRHLQPVADKLNFSMRLTGSFFLALLDYSTRSSDYLPSVLMAAAILTAYYHHNYVLTESMALALISWDASPLAVSWQLINRSECLPLEIQRMQRPNCARQTADAQTPRADDSESENGTQFVNGKIMLFNYV